MYHAQLDCRYFKGLHAFMLLLAPVSNRVSLSLQRLSQPDRYGLLEAPVLVTAVPVRQRCRPSLGSLLRSQQTKNQSN